MMWITKHDGPVGLVMVAAVTCLTAVAWLLWQRSGSSSVGLTAAYLDDAAELVELGRAVERELASDP